MSESKTGSTHDNIGTKRDSFPVELSARFLKHFSEQLYRSPQKAFEELISNSWDAGASYVDVRVSEDLSSQNATMCVLDNGSSMDASGLKELWKIAYSPKVNQPTQYGRQVIGQFGIGKLSTYVLAHKLTFICKAEDGIIRRVTMDYSVADEGSNPEEEKLFSELTLDLFELSASDVDDCLNSINGGGEIGDMIREGFPAPSQDITNDEFGGPTTNYDSPPSGCWTLVILSGIKPIGRELKIGVLRRMLQASLPLGADILIFVNGEPITSSKVSLLTHQEWLIGPDLGIEHIKISMNGNPEDVEHVDVESNNMPYPHVKIQGIGEVTGTVKLFYDKLTGGKSGERGTSNGFVVNVLGRIVNRDDPSFGELNLSHAAWSKFRMTVRADGLNRHITINRDQFKDTREMLIFKAFLRKVFNKGRTFHDSDENSILPDGGDVLIKSLGVISLSPLRSLVTETLRKKAPLPGLFDETDIEDREEKLSSWTENTQENIKHVLGEVKFDKFDDGGFVKFRIADNSIIVNANHPFVLEHSSTKREKELVRTLAMVMYLTDIFSLNIGVEGSHLISIRDYREQLMKYKALQKRQSGIHIARLLHDVEHDSDYRKLEAVASDALSWLGYDVEDLAKPGEPEGIASAYAIPTLNKPTVHDPRPPLYKFTWDAKSTKHDKVQTNNINLAGVVHHREQYSADYALVIAPEFQDGGLVEQCQTQKVTPIRAKDLGKMLEVTVQYGAIPVTHLRGMFDFYDPALVSEWVDGLADWIQQNRELTLDLFLEALDKFRKKMPDVLDAGTIAFTCREDLGALGVRDNDVIAVAKGLSIAIPELIGIKDKSKIEINAKPSMIKNAIEKQLEAFN